MYGEGWRSHSCSKRSLIVNFLCFYVAIVGGGARGDGYGGGWGARWGDGANDGANFFAFLFRLSSRSSQDRVMVKFFFMTTVIAHNCLHSWYFPVVLVVLVYERAMVGRWEWRRVGK